MPERATTPAIVSDLAIRLGGDHQGPQTVRFRQRGRMRQDEASGWIRFRASQSISLTDCAFDWRARTGPAGLVFVRDALTGGEGRVDVGFLGVLPIARVEATHQLNRGELIRYLAEIPWAPGAITRNSALRWRVEADRIFVATGAGETSAEVMFTLDTDGRISEAFATDRPRAVKGGFVDTPWCGRFCEYRRCGGALVPFAGAVSWVINGQEVVVWEGRLKEWEHAGSLNL